MKMRMFQGADVSFSEHDVAALEMLMTRKNAENEVVEHPPEFPLEGALVVFNGDQATISINQAGKRKRRVCRLVNAKLTDPRTPKDKTVITGTASELVQAGFRGEEAMITAVIERYVVCKTC